MMRPLLEISSLANIVEIHSVLSDRSPSREDLVTKIEFLVASRLIFLMFSFLFYVVET